MQNLDEDALERLAVSEIMGEAKRGKERYHHIGVSGWEKPKVPPTNKRFLERTLMSTKVRLNKGPPKKESSPKKHSCNRVEKKTRTSESELSIYSRSRTSKVEESETTSSTTRHLSSSEQSSRYSSHKQSQTERNLNRRKMSSSSTGHTDYKRQRNNSEDRKFYRSKRLSVELSPEHKYKKRK